MLVCKVKCGDKEATIRIQRPNFDDCKMAYEKISKLDNIDNNKIEESKNRLYIAILKKQLSKEKMAKYTEEMLNKYVFSEITYFNVGGGAYQQFINDWDFYYNTCALRISYALNQTNIPIKTMTNQLIDRNYTGDDKQLYYLGVFDIVNLLNKNWKKLSWQKPTFNQVKQKIQCGCSEDFYKNMTTKAENKTFFDELQSLQIKGIVAMIGTSGLRHTTLWDIDNFVDVKIGISKNYLNKTDYIIRECYFWDMK